MSVFMNINHEEFEGQDTYEGVQVSLFSRSEGGRTETHNFSTGDVVADWNEAIAFARELLKSDPDSPGFIQASSDVDHFIGEDPQAFEIDENGFMYRVAEREVV